MTISPPAKVNLGADEPAAVLAHGLDGLSLAIDVRWGERDPFAELDALKKSAEAKGQPCPGVARFQDDEPSWVFNVAPHGTNGYAWLLLSKDLTLRVGGWHEPMSRPSVMARVSSEALWTRGPEAMSRRVEAILGGWGGQVEAVRASQVDLCADILLPEDNWTLDLLDAFVTRAKDTNPYLHCRKLTGFQIGRGGMLARLYDKPCEIVNKSHKFWMYDVWGIGAVPDGHRVIRVEFQMRREVLKRLSLDTFADLMASLPQLWAYASRSWLKLQSGTGPHHTQRHNLPWWNVVQGAYVGALNVEPEVRARAIGDDAGRLLRSLLGYLASYSALKLGHEPMAVDQVLSMRSVLDQARLHLIALGVTNEEFTDKVKLKHAMHARLNDYRGGGSGALGPGSVD